MSATSMITPESLADRILQFLDDEERRLEAAHAVLQEQRRALASGRRDAAAHAARQQERLAHDSIAWTRQRDVFRREIARLVQLPFEDTTISNLLRRLPPPLGEQVRKRRLQIRAIADRVERLEQDNAAVLYYCLESFDRALAGLLGSGSDSSRYGPAGKFEDAPARSLINARG